MQPSSYPDADKAMFVKDPHLVKTKGSQGHNNGQAKRQRYDYCKEYGHTKPTCELFQNSKCVVGNSVSWIIILNSFFYHQFFLFARSLVLAVYELFFVVNLFIGMFL